MKVRFPSRSTFAGALLFNLVAFIIPAIYSTLSKLWIAQIDASVVVVTDAWTYMSILTEIVNEGLSRVAYAVVGDLRRPIGERLELTSTLIAGQGLAGLILSVILALAAPGFASAFVPIEVRASSMNYIRISSFSTWFGVIQYAVEAATRSLDRPDVPVVISLCKTILNIILDLVFLSTFRVGDTTPTVNTQAAIRLGSDALGALAGLIYLAYSVRKIMPRETTFPRPTFRSLSILLRPAKFTITETALRNGLYLWLTNGIVQLGSQYATAFGVFNTIRWGLIMVPALAIDQTSVVMMGHRWGTFCERFGDPKSWRKDALHHKDSGSESSVLEENHTISEEEAEETQRVDIERTSSVRKRAPQVDLETQETLPSAESPAAAPTSAHPSYRDIIDLARPAIIALIIILILETILAITLSVGPVRSYAYFLSNDEAVADLATRMFRSLDWTYVLFTASMPLASILLATRVDLWFANSLATNIFWVLPWCIFFAVKDVPVENAWTYHSIVFGGSLVLGFFVTIGAVGVWAWHLRHKRPFQPKWARGFASL